MSVPTSASGLTSGLTWCSVPGPDGTEAVKRILGVVSMIAVGLAELRNRGYGTGHGAARAWVGLRAGMPAWQ
jgi:hypothetical protein